MKRVMVIDDDILVSKYIQSVLQVSGFETVALRDGSNALNLQRKYFFDLVITDLIMPVKDGIATIIELRKEFPDLKIIAISGGGFSKDGECLSKKAERVGAFRTLAKPLQLSMLLQTIQDALA